MRILVVEDEQALNELLVKQLQAAHYSVDGCLTGSDALDYLLGAEYDAVVLDIMLPVMDGWAVLKKIREHDKTPSSCSPARGDDGEARRRIEGGADDYIVKPLR